MYNIIVYINNYYNEYIYEKKLFMHIIYSLHKNKKRI